MKAPTAEQLNRRYEGRATAIRIIVDAGLASKAEAEAAAKFARIAAHGAENEPAYTLARRIEKALDLMREGDIGRVVKKI